MFSYMSIYHRPPFCPPGMKHHPEFEHNRMQPPPMNDKFKKLMGEDKAEMKKLREDFNQSREDFMKILANDTLNVKQAEAAMEASLKAHEDLERHLGTSLIKVRQNMTGKEAETFFKKRLERLDYKRDKFKHNRERMMENDEDHERR
jgi:hypothetical protein